MFRQFVTDCRDTLDLTVLIMLPAVLTYCLYLCYDAYVVFVCIHMHDKEAGKKWINCFDV